MLLPAWGQLAWWGIFSGRRGAAERVVHQAAIVAEPGVLLTLRPDLYGWELPGGAPLPGESGEDAVRREVLEETGLDVAVERFVGEYHRTGFGAHRARVYRCRVVGGALRTSDETPAVAWFDPVALPHTLLPWYRGPLADALAPRSEPVERHERQGVRSIVSGMVIDLVMRWRGPEAR